jgi:hypothetical protein
MPTADARLRSAGSRPGGVASSIQNVRSSHASYDSLNERHRRSADEQGGAMKYMILMYSSQQDYDALAGKAVSGEPAWSVEDFAAMGTFMESFNRGLAEAGELVETRGLTAPAHTRRIQLQDGAPVITDGPYPETQEVLAGYWIVDCESFDRATEIAAQLTNCPNPGGDYSSRAIDVRPIAESRNELEL